MTRILLIIPSLQKGGAERIVIDIVRELRKQQFVQVYLVIFQNKIDYEVEDIADLIHIIPSKVVLSAYKTNKSDVKDLQKFITTFNPDIIHTHLFEAEIVSRQCCFPSAKWYSHCHDNMHLESTPQNYPTLLSYSHLTLQQPTISALVR